MLDIRKFIEGVEVADARSAIYYVSRYVKQAASFDEYGKNIFEDEERSAPSEAVCRLALNIIKAIEAHEGVKIAGLKDDRTVELLDFLTLCERDLGSQFSDAELAVAAKITASISAPPIKE
jgi:hypothetical protein